MAGNLAGVIEILGGPVIALLQTHVILGFVKQIFFQTQAVLLWFGPHPLRAFAYPDRAGLVDSHDRGNERAGVWAHLRGLLQWHALTCELC